MLTLDAAYVRATLRAMPAKLGGTTEASPFVPCHVG